MVACLQIGDHILNELYVSLNSSYGVQEHKAVTEAWDFMQKLVFNRFFFAALFKCVCCVCCVYVCVDERERERCDCASMY